MRAPTPHPKTRIPNRAGLCWSRTTRRLRVRHQPVLGGVGFGDVPHRIRVAEPGLRPTERFTHHDDWAVSSFAKAMACRRPRQTARRRPRNSSRDRHRAAVTTAPGRTQWPLTMAHYGYRIESQSDARIDVGRVYRSMWTWIVTIVLLPLGLIAFVLFKQRVTVTVRLRYSFGSLWTAAPKS